MSISANSEAVDAIAKADMIVLGPGDLFTSLLPTVLVEGIPEAIRTSKATKVYVCNLMTKYGQTYGFTAKDHVETLQRYIGISPDYVVVNNAVVPNEALKHYATFHENPVIDNLQSTPVCAVVRADVISGLFTEKSKSDTLVRSLIRHDSMKLASILHDILIRKEKV